MDWEFHAYEGFGPLQFGQSRAQVIATLGSPDAVDSTYEQLKHAIDPELHDKACIALLKRKFTMTFSDRFVVPVDLWTIFSDDVLTGVHLSGVPKGLSIAEVSIDGRDKAAVVRQLARKEQVMLFSGSDYYFESIGFRITAPKFWRKQGSLGMYSRQGFEDEMTFAGPYEYSPKEITGKER